MGGTSWWRRRRGSCRASSQPRPPGALAGRPDLSGEVFEELVVLSDELAVDQHQLLLHLVLRQAVGVGHEVGKLMNRESAPAKHLEVHLHNFFL